MEKRTEDIAMKRTHLAVGAVGAALSLAALSFYGVFAAASVGVGAIVASLNLYVLSRTVHNMLDGRSLSWGGVAFVKFTVLLAVTYGLINGGLVQPLALAVGFGALPFGILLAGAFGVPAQPASAKTDHA